ncbi:MAG: hypothetical protein COA41_00645 [Sphingopyxis sp.]|nr:MAG: hypothetical protein COA41_00645 [Sphingopyxis sp.]
MPINNPPNIVQNDSGASGAINAAVATSRIDDVKSDFAEMKREHNNLLKQHIELKGRVDHLPIKIAFACLTVFGIGGGVAKFLGWI